MYEALDAVRESAVLRIRFGCQFLEVIRATIPHRLSAQSVVVRIVQTRAGPDSSSPGAPGPVTP